MFGLKRGQVVKQLAIVVVANFTVFQVGIGFAWLSPALVKVSSPNQTELSRPITEEEGAWLVSISSLVGPLALLLAGWLANRIGRKRTILIYCVPRLVSCLLLICPTEPWMLLLSRCLSGLTDLVHTIVTATYSAELASKEIRGGLGTVSQIMSCLGAMIMLTIGPFVSFQSLNIIYICLVVGTTIPILFIPETPYYLFFRGQKEELVKVLTFLRGSESLAHAEISEYSSTDETKFTREIFTDAVLIKTFAKVLILVISSQLIGYNMVSNYLQTIFDSTHTNISSEVSSLIIGCIQMIACFCTILLTDRLGRKPILAITMAGLTVGMVGMGTFFKLTENQTDITGFLNYLPLISIALVIFCFNAGLGSILWTLVAEHLDGPYRTICFSFTVAPSSICSFLTMKFFPEMITSLGPATTYYIFAGCCVWTGLFIAIFIIETKGKAFSQIQKEMGRTVAVTEIKAMESLS